MPEQVTPQTFQEVRPQTFNIMLWVIVFISIVSMALSAYTLYRVMIMEKAIPQPAVVTTTSAEPTLTTTTALTEETSHVPTTTPTNSQIHPENSQLVTNTISPTMQKLTFRINPAVFTVEKQPKSETTGTELATILLRDAKNQSEIPLLFKDLTQSPKYSPNAEMGDMTYIGGAPEKSTLPAVTINGKKFEFTAARFGEGFPDGENSNCFSGGGVLENYFKLTPEIAVFVESHYSEKGCDNKIMSLTDSLTPTMIKEIQKVLETVQVQ